MLVQCNVGPVQSNVDPVPTDMWPSSGVQWKSGVALTVVSNVDILLGSIRVVFSV